MTISRKRLIALGAFLAAWVVVVAGRLVQIQLVDHDEFVARATRQQERTIALTPSRGSIRDARGRILAESVPAQSIYADPQSISDPRDAAKQLASIKALGLVRSQLEKKLRGSGEFAWVARQVPDSVAAEVRKLQIPGIFLLEEHVRAYPKGRLAAPVLGFVGIDGEGLAGAEHSFDAYLGGRAGKVTVLRDARRGVYLVGGEGKNAPVDGQHVVLTIDEVVQYVAETTLREAVGKCDAKAGSVVVMDPSTGALLALASWPDFDPNNYNEFPRSSWRDKPIQDLYEPGSTFKIVTAASALEDGRVTPSQIIDCGDGSIQIATARIREHGGHSYGYLSFQDVIANSSNVGTIKVGMSIGPERFYRHILDFGFGTRSGIDLPGEADGLLRPPRRWSALSNAVISIGQEIGVTPLQIARAAAAVANGGYLVTPHVLDRVVDGEGKVIAEFKPPEHKRVVSEKTAAVLNEILKNVVAHGTGKNAALDDHVVAGKTGTAQKPENGRYSPDKTVASFVGYVPADRPRLVVLVVIDEPRIGQYGGEIAAPAFRKIADASLRYLRIEPSIPGRNLDVDLPKLAGFSQQAPAVDTNDTGAGMPDFRGLDARAAISKAGSLGMRVKTQGSGVVASQSPGPGEPLGSGRLVTLTLASAMPVRATVTEEPGR